MSEIHIPHHVFLLEMGRDDDLYIWEYASQNDYTIVTRDSELCNRSDLAEIIALTGEEDQRKTQNAILRFCVLYLQKLVY